MRVALALLLVLSGCVGGASSHDPGELETGLSPKAATAVRRAWEGIDGSKLFDHHTHMIGTGAGGTGNFVNPEHAILREIYDFNPLLFDFMVKRLVHAPGTTTRFAPSVFMENSSLQR
jgi:hypothetical protein